MRRNNNLSISKIALIIIILIIAFVFLMKVLNKGDNKKYISYVNDYTVALEKYINNDIIGDIETTFTFDQINNILISKGYISKYDEEDVNVSSDNIVIKKNGSNTEFYNYVNITTLENRFELKFNKDNKEIICTKIECK